VDVWFFLITVARSKVKGRGHCYHRPAFAGETAGGAQTGRWGGSAPVTALPGSNRRFAGLFVCRYGQTTSQILSEAKELA